MLTDQLKQEYEITYIVRKIREKQYHTVPETIELTYDCAVPKYNDNAQAVISRADINQPISRSYLYYCEWAGLEKISETEFDCAIAFNGVSPWCLATALHRVKAAKRMVWFHRNPELYIMTGDIVFWKRVYQQFDKVFVATEGVKGGFCRLFPEYNYLIEIIPPIADVEVYERLAEQEFENPYNKDSLNLLTVRRLSIGCGMELIPSIAAQIKKEFSKFRWFIIGDGDIRDRILQQIIVQDVCDEVILLGERKNIYPYIRNCDIYAALLGDTEDEALMAARAMNKPMLRFGIPNTYSVSANSADER